MIRRRGGCGLCFALLNFAVGFTQITLLGRLTEELVIVSSQVLLSSAQKKTDWIHSTHA
jgi:pyruvate/2-oxoacid:ferredoxin oxidoreductase beta subunit